MTKVFLVSHFAPSAVGHGGQHRTLQLEYDACDVLGDSRVASVNLELWREARRRAASEWPRPIRRAGVNVCWFHNRIALLRTRASSVAENPFRLLRVPRYATAIPFSTTAWVESAFIAHYRDIVSKVSGPKICVIEHAVFGKILELNAQLRIPTISAFQNLEALDATRFDWRSRKVVYTVMTDLATELRLLGRCSGRLVISKVEAGFLGGLGLGCNYYPYLPVGAIRQRLRKTRERRVSGRIDPGLILLLGSAAHGVTGESMRWFAQAAAQYGLPPGVKVVAVGFDSQKLLPAGQSVPGLELRGWVDQSDLDDLLSRAAAAVIPQQLGFGAVTRLPELACVGVPVIAFSHVGYALDATPGLRIVEADWGHLQEAMRDTLVNPLTVEADEYERWEARQPRPLASAIERILRTHIDHEAFVI